APHRGGGGRRARRAAPAHGGPVPRLDGGGGGAVGPLAPRPGGIPLRDGDGHPPPVPDRGAGGGGRTEGTRVRDRVRLRQAQGRDDPHRTYGRPHGRGTSRAPRSAGGGTERMSEPRFRVLVTDEVDPEGIAILRSQDGIQVDEVPTLPPAELLEIIGQYDAMVGRSATRISRELLERA